MMWGRNAAKAIFFLLLIAALGFTSAAAADSGGQPVFDQENLLIADSEQTWTITIKTFSPKLELDDEALHHSYGFYNLSANGHSGVNNAFLCGAKKNTGANTKWRFKATVSLIIAGITVTKMISNSKSKITANGRTYLADSGMDIIHQSDKFSHTTVVQRKINSGKRRRRRR